MQLSFVATPMRYIRHPAFAAPISRIGFGCASLGSRVGAREGLAALDRAYEASVTWYDTAPPFGDGSSETILGQFIGRRRDKVQIVTKVGIVPARRNAALALVKPIAQRIVAAVPSLRQTVSRVRPQATKVALTGEFVRLSLRSSPTRLWTDYVDALALHEPTMQDIDRDDVIMALEEALDRGQASTIGIAGSSEIGSFARRRCPRIGLLQYASDPFENAANHASHEDGPIVVTNSVLVRLRALSVALQNDAETRVAVEQFGYSHDVRVIAPELLVDLALRTNRDGIVLLSMFDAGHLAANASRVELDLEPRAIELLRYVFTSIKSMN
nr:aldo/keto reductase [uncultured Rhodopila sp.]